MSPPKKQNKNDSNGRQKEKQDRKSLSSIPSHEHHGSQESSRNKHTDMKKTQRKNKLDVDSDASSPRSHRAAQHLAGEKTKKPRQSRWESKHSDSDLSPPRLNQMTDKNPQKNSAKNSRQCSVDSDLSPPRLVKINQEPGTEKQTLDGKKAGLQDAKTLKEETERLKKKEKDHFDKMSDLVSGRGASTVVRDRKTGKRRDVAREQQELLEKEEADEEKLADFKRLGKGLVQVEQQAQRLQEHMHEMNKPLARYADDQDLEELLKAQEREGDPMLEYLREKKQQENPTAAKPRYQGPAPPPNRFNVQPGHRWDGVDRSTGYEKRLFEQMNAKKALEEEAYKWSVSDM